MSNVLTLDDKRLAGEWPAGAAPVTTKTFGYDDDYRLTSATSTYAKTTDTFVTPVPAATPTTSPLPVLTGGGRMRSQTFRYDGLGNTLQSTDDAGMFFDRSLGLIANGNGTGHAPNQLTSAAQPTGAAHPPNNLSASYDAGGNLVQLSVNRTGTCSSSAGCNQLLRYDWDEVGHLAHARRWDFAQNGGPGAYTYPALPTAVAEADVAYAYDATGTRVLRASTPAGETTATYSAEIFPSLRLDHTTWSASTELYARTASTEAVYLALGGSIYGRVVYDTTLPNISGAQHVFLELTDGLGSTSAVIDRDTSELVERTTYLPYGALDSDYRPARWEQFREDYKFTGKEDDVEVGLTYFGARYYSPQLGRFVSPDPLAIHALAADLNPYAYVHGRVTSLTDPLGLEASAGSSSTTTDDDDGDEDGIGAQPSQGAVPTINLDQIIIVGTAPAPAGGPVGPPSSPLTIDGPDPGPPPPHQATSSGGQPPKPPVNDSSASAGGNYDPVTQWLLSQEDNGNLAALQNFAAGFANAASFGDSEKLFRGLGIKNDANSTAFAVGGIATVLIEPEAAAAGAAERLAAEAVAPSSRALGAALEEAGFVRGTGEAAHHIVAGSAEAAAPARAVLQRFGIGINDAANGRFLPGNLAAENAGGAAVHSTLHTAEYYRAVNAALGGATSREGALLILNDIGESLSGGGFP